VQNPEKKNFMLMEMIANNRISHQYGKHARTWSEKFLSIAFVLHSSSAKSYRILKKCYLCRQSLLYIGDLVQS
jgi:endonuclease YncB( thermonuclease family)